MTEKTSTHDWPSPSDLDRRPKATPYVGIAGFTDPHEVRSIAADAYTIRPYGAPDIGGRRLSVGVLARWETLNGGPSAGNPDRHPKIEDIRALFNAAVEPSLVGGIGDNAGDAQLAIKDRTLRLIHYQSREPNLVAQVDRLCEMAGPNLDGFQFNIVWPDPDDIREIALEYPTLRIIVQINGEMFSNVARNPQLLVKELAAKYAAHATDYLFDMSGGTGAAIDMKETTAVLDALYGAFGGASKGGLGIGIAGGLDYKNVYGLKPLFERWPDLSIDAEGRIRDSYVDARKETVTYLNEGAREYARRGIALARGVLGRKTTR
jgi:hypothetical protein